MSAARFAGVAVVLAVLAFGSAAAQAQQLLSGVTGSQCSSRGGQITTWTNTAGRGPNVGDCYIAPRSGGGRTGGFTGGGGGGLGALGAGLQFLDALSTFVDSLPSNDAPSGDTQPVYDYKQTPEYREMERQQRALQSALAQETDDLQSFVRSARPSSSTASSTDMCKASAQSQGDFAQCYRTAAAGLEQEAANCGSGSCRATMLRAAASARCVAALEPSAANVSATIEKCGKDPASGLQRVAAADARQASGASQVAPAAHAAAAPAAPAKTASAAPAKPANVQGGRWIATGSAAECQKLAQSSIARHTAGYYDLCVSDPPSKPVAAATNGRPSAQRRTTSAPPPSPFSELGCGWYGGSLRPDGSCWVIGAITDDCLHDLHGRVTEDGGYKYCVIGRGPDEGTAPRRAAAPTSEPSAASTPASDEALDQCRDGAVAPWTIAGCYNLMAQPAAQNRPGALAAKLRARLASAARSEQDREDQRAAESAEEAAVAAQLYREWRSEALHRYDRWVAAKNPFVAEDAKARDACTGRWTYDGTSVGTCDPDRSRARWEVAFEQRQPPSEPEAQRVASNGSPWRTNSETDCRNVGGIPIKPTADNDITGIPSQLLDDPTVDQEALKRSFLCYQTLGRSN